MPRMYIADRTGTGQDIVTDLDPADYYYLDDDPAKRLITTETTPDPFRPVRPDGAGRFLPIRNEAFIVIEPGPVPQRPPGVINLGDPTDAANLSSTLRQAQVDALDVRFPRAAGRFDGMTVRRACIFLATDDDGQLPEFRFRFGRGRWHRLWRSDDLVPYDLGPAPAKVRTAPPGSLPGGRGT